MASQVEDGVDGNALKKELWLAIAKHIIKDNKDIPGCGAMRRRFVPPPPHTHALRTGTLPLPLPPSSQLVWLSPARRGAG